jgi:hypothetical protein
VAAHERVRAHTHALGFSEHGGVLNEYGDWSISIAFSLSDT